MEFEIRHVTKYAYGQPAAEAYGEARLTPPTLPGQAILSHRLVIEPETATSHYTDHYGNRVDFFSLPYRHRKLSITNHVTVSTRPIELPVQALDISTQEARQIFASVLPDVFDYLQPTATVVLGREAVQWARRFFRGDKRLGSALQQLNEAVHDTFDYQKGFTDNSTPLSTIWKERKGVCQDFAHVALSVLRTAGIPARYVCGYIDAAGDSGKLVGALATHAWVEALLPGMTWAALDPTNRQWTNERYVTVSYGRDFRDASPLRGTFKGSGGQKMDVKVYVKRRGKNAA